MVRVQGADTLIGKLGDFFLDRYEVTNRQYKDFTGRGGYRKKEYWKHAFAKGGKRLEWDEAMREFVDQTGQPGPATWQAGDYPEGQDDFPVSGVSWHEAAAFAEFAAPFTNFEGKGPAAVGGFPSVTAFGAFDMPGNVREWCWNETSQGRLIRGGAWNDNPYMFGNQSQAPPMDRSPTSGFRCALYPAPAGVPPRAFERATPAPIRDFSREKPVEEAVYRVYKEQSAYDKTELNVKVESRRDSPGGWIHEKVSFDAAYGGERMLAHLFLPKDAAPPYQTVICFPGSASLSMASSESIETYYEFPMFLSFVVKNGRAALDPVYKGTFERRWPAIIPIHGGADTRLYTEFLTQIVKDFRRSIDYLETRPDIDSRKLAYYGMSWGAILGAVILAVEERPKVSVLVGGRLGRPGRPEANGLTYVTRVRMQTPMLAGRYENSFESGVRPMFDLLGTPAEHKRLIAYDTDHIPPRNEYVKEILAWLDKYLGPVKR